MFKLFLIMLFLIVGCMVISYTFSFLKGFLKPIIKCIVTIYKKNAQKIF